MSSEAISAGIMITGAAIAAAFLVAAILPAIFTAGGTFGTVAHSADNQIRTDFEIIRAFTPTVASGTAPVDIWIKNTGQIRFNSAEIESMDVFFGNYQGIKRLVYTSSPPNEGFFSFIIEGVPGAMYWNPGDTLHINTTRAQNLQSPYYFALVAPNGVEKTHIFGGIGLPKTP